MMNNNQENGQEEGNGNNKEDYDMNINVDSKQP